MAVNDPIADMLTRIRNAHMALHKQVAIPKSNIKLAIAEILKEEGFIQHYDVVDRDIKIKLKYVHGSPAVKGLKRMSRPGCRAYVGVDQIPRVQNGLGINILSTSKGILDGEVAKKQRIGGELLCQVW